MLLVQQGTCDADLIWCLPGGVVDVGELLHETLVREVKEETGLCVLSPGRLALISQHYEAGARDPVTAFTFEVAACQGELSVADPDHLVQRVEFVDVVDVVALIAGPPRWPMGSPVASYLAGTGRGAGTAWFWRLSGNGADEPLAVLPIDGG